LSVFVLQAVLEQLQDAQEGVMSVTSPGTQQDLASLADSMQALDKLAQQLQQQQQQQPASTAGQAAPSSSFAKLWRNS
jgi:cell division protein FtsN